MPSLGQAAVRYLHGPWVAFFAAIMVSMVAGGSPFHFPVYSKAIKKSMGNDNKALSMLAVSKNLGASFGFLTSLIYDVAPPQVVLASVAAMNLVGVVAYLVPYLAVSGCMRIARPAVPWLMCISIAVGANSQSFAMTGALVSSVKHFPDDRGPVLSLLLAFAGLGGDIFIQFGRATNDHDGAAILLFMACLYLVQLPFACTSIRAIPAGPARSGSGVERRGLMRVVRVSVFAGACLLVLHVVDLVVADLPRPAYYVTASFLAVFLVISLVVIAMKQESSPARTGATSGGDAPAVPSSSTIMLTSNNPTPSCFPMENYSVLRAVFSVEMLLTFLLTFVIGSCVQTPIDIIDQVAQSLQYKHGTTSKLVSLVTLSDYAGRLVGGFGSEYMVARYRLPRPLALTVALLLVCFGHVLIALGLTSGLYAASVIMGFCLGAQWTVVFVTISEMFGTRNLAALYNLAGLPSAVGSYIFNVQVTGRLYDRELQRQSSTADHTCIGVHCFRESFFILVGVTLFGAVVSAVLALRVWRFYRAPIGSAAVVVAPVDTAVDRSSSKEDETMVV